MVAPYTTRIVCLSHARLWVTANLLSVLGRQARAYKDQFSNSWRDPFYLSLAKTYDLPYSTARCQVYVNTSMLLLGHN